MILVLVFSFVALHVHIASNLDNQWDLRRYYYGAVAYASGLNPYDSQVLNKISNGQKVYEFDYPPPSLYFFQLLALFDYSTAYQIFLYGKLILLLGLIYLWVKEFIPKETDPLFYLFCLVAYTGAFYWDIRSGNVIILEQVFIWMAFYMFLKHRYIFFCLLILMASIFKITPILFLFLLWFSKDKKQILYSLLTIALFGILFLISYLSSPVQFNSFMHFLLVQSVSNEDGLFNPSTLSLFKDIFIMLAIKTGFVVSPLVPKILYDIITLAVAFVSWKTILLLRAKQNKETEKITIFFFCVMYALILPLFKPYSYILLIVPSWFIMKRMSAKTAYWTILILSLFFSYLFNISNWYYDIVLKQFYSHLYAIFYLSGYFALFCAFAVWGLYIWAIRHEVLGDSQSSASIL